MHNECQNIFIAEVVSLILALLDKVTMKHKYMHTRRTILSIFIREHKSRASIPGRFFRYFHSKTMSQVRTISIKICLPLSIKLFRFSATTAFFGPGDTKLKKVFSDGNPQSSTARKRQYNVCKITRRRENKNR